VETPCVKPTFFFFFFSSTPNDRIDYGKMLEDAVTAAWLAKKSRT